MAFERLQGFVELSIEYETLSALAVHAGKGGSFEVSDAPVIMSNDLPIIPGSSLKGALRSTLEALLAQAGFEVCVPDAAIPNEWRGQRVRSPKDRQEYAQSIGRKAACAAPSPCPICQIFGTAGGRQGLAGRASFLDAWAQPGYRIVERTHVAIARNTRAQAGGKLMNVQAVDAGATFRGKIRLVNAEDWMVGALLRALEGVEQLGLGAKKTAGYGAVRIEVTGIETRKPTHDGWDVQAVEPDAYRAAFTRMLKQHEK
jgi:CRISPR-associated protein Csm3